jgi:PIN domain nuclease of toxin-antitoxin system
VALLLDTHAFLWYIDNDPRLSAIATNLISDPATRVVVSVVSAWEIVIKLGTGKLSLGRPFRELWTESMAANAFEILEVTTDHVFAVERLPMYHRDPFDRLLIAQAISENLQIVTADSAFGDYPVQRIW